MALAYHKKDRLPGPDYYDLALLKDPVQQETRAKPFIVQADDYIYQITPRYEYELNGVVVSYHDADAIDDVAHHKRWMDFLNLRDICVVWDQNITSQFYKKAHFHNDTWTCWTQWEDRQTGELFNGTQLSNNHILSTDPYLNKQILSAEVGDQIRLSGILANYKNPSNGFYRKTSTIRTDTGNGACETIYVTDFEVIKKANSGWRNIYQGAKWFAITSLVGFFIMLFIAPVRRGIK